MTATPHKGDPDNFCLFLSLLDKDVYGDVKSLEEAMTRQEAPFYLRRLKEALVSFPDPETSEVKALFTRRNVKTVPFEISEEEFDLYDSLTQYVESQSIRAAREDSARARAVGFTMAMLQRRFASSIYAVRRTLERMKEKRERILADPEKYRQEQISRRLPDDFDELPDDEKQEIIAEHKDTLDFLAGDGKDGRPLGKLREWGLSLTQIHGGMKIGDRDSPGTRIYAEREFRENAQILIATEAAGEGINLQFCWLMIN